MHFYDKVIYQLCISHFFKASIMASDVAAVPHLAVLEPLEYCRSPNVHSLYYLGNVCFFFG